MTNYNFIKSQEILDIKSNKIEMLENKIVKKVKKINHSLATVLKQ